MKVAVTGAGSIGKRHIKNLQKIGIHNDNIFVLEPREDRISELKDFGITNCLTDINEFDNIDINCAVICSPTSLHIDQSIYFAKKKSNLMIEKPLARDLEGIETLLEIVKANNIITFIAYIFRFAPSVKYLKSLIEQNSIGKIYYVRGEFSEYLPDWHPYEKYNSFYMAEKKQGGGSILDQSHIMDLVHHLFGNFKSVSAFNERISNLEINADDVAEMIIELESGPLVSIHTDIFGRQHKKYLEIKGEKGNIFWDFYKNSVQIYNPENKEIIEKKDFGKDFNEVYIEEISYFIDCCKNNKAAKPDINVGIDTMKLILAAENSHKQKKQVII